MNSIDDLYFSGHDEIQISSEGIIKTKPLLSCKSIKKVEDWFNGGHADSLKKHVGNENSRLAIHFGYTYDYVNGNVKETDPFPKIVRSLANHAYKKTREIFGDVDVYDQCIVNYYEPGQGISAHIDLPSSFGEYIACYTFGGGREMEFNTEPPTRLYTVPGSLYIMSGNSRYTFKHQMRARKKDFIDGKPINRKKCFSVTFRSVNK